MNEKYIIKSRRFLHAKKRAKERYDINLTKADTDRIIKLIQGQRSKPIGSLSAKKKVHLVHYNNEDVIVIYSNKTKTILTLLPKECACYQEYLKNVRKNEPQTTSHSRENGREGSNIIN